MLDPYRRVLRRLRWRHLRFARGPECPLIVQRCPSLLARGRFPTHQVGLRYHAIHVWPRTSNALSSPRLDASLRFASRLSLLRNHLPHKQARPATGRTSPPGLARVTAARSHRTVEMRFRRAKLFKLNRAVAVHNFSGRVYLLVRTRGKNDDAPASEAFNVSFRVRFGGPGRPKLPDEVHLKIGVCGTHHPATPHVLRFAQYPDVVAWKTAGLKIVNNSIDRLRLLKQANCSSCHLDLHKKWFRPDISEA